MYSAVAGHTSSLCTAVLGGTAAVVAIMACLLNGCLLGYVLRLCTMLTTVGLHFRGEFVCHHLVWLRPVEAVASTACLGILALFS